MDALTLLRHVSDTYRNLKSLAVEAAIATESGDENSSQRTEHRVDFSYAAPDRIRYQSRARSGIDQVSDGKQLHTNFGRHRGVGGDAGRYSSIPIAEMRRLPHLFRSEFPCGTGDEPFLYQGVEQNVTAAQILREEDGCHVVSATYPPPPYPRLVMSAPDVLFWVDSKNHMVLRQQSDLGHRFPTEDEVTWTRHTISVRQMRMNEPLPDTTFQFTPPPDATPLTAGRCGVSFGGGAGFAEQRPDGAVEHQASHEWQGDTLIERSKWKLRGMTLTFERRLTFSADGKELRVAERITGPRGEVESQSHLVVG